jgi:hypothetical protein
MALIPMLEGRVAMFAVVWGGVRGIGRDCVSDGGEYTAGLSSLQESQSYATMARSRAVAAISLWQH